MCRRIKISKSASGLAREGEPGPKPSPSPLVFHAGHSRVTWKDTRKNRPYATCDAYRDYLSFYYSSRHQNLWQHHGHHRYHHNAGVCATSPCDHPRFRFNNYQLRNLEFTTLSTNTSQRETAQTRLRYLRRQLHDEYSETVAAKQGYTRPAARKDQTRECGGGTCVSPRRHSFRIQCC